jgi:hypothetical protein
MFIPDPGSGFFSIPDPGSSSKNLSILTPKKAKKWFLSSKKYDPGCSSRIRRLTFSHPGSRIQGSKRHPIPDPGSATLFKNFKKQCERTVYRGKIIFFLTAGRGVSSIQGGVLVIKTNTTFESLVYNRPQDYFSTQALPGMK